MSVDKTRVGRRYVHRIHEIAVVVGKDVFTRKELMHLADCGNFEAAKNLTEALMAFKPVSITELAPRIDQYMIRDGGKCGDTAIFVFMCLVQSRGMDPEAWAAQHITKRKKKKR